MKRILLVANVAREHVLKFHVPTIKMLSEDGWLVDIACSGEEKIPFCHKQYQLSYERASVNINTIKGIFELKQIIDKGNYDIIYCHTTVGGFAGRIAGIKARRKGAKIIYLAHGYYFFRGAPLKNWLFFYPIEKILEPLTDSIITINEEDYSFSKKHFAKCKSYRINGIGADFSRLKVDERNKVRTEYRKEMGIPLEAPVLIYMAELHVNKNQLFLIRLVKQMLQDGENVYLILPGIDHTDGEYQEYAEKLGVADHVRFLGWRNDIGNLYAMADICTASSLREGLPMNIVESMASGVPVVAINNRGHNSIICDGYNGFIVEPGKGRLFEKRVRTLIHNKKIYTKMSSNCISSAELYRSEAVLNDLKRILEEHLQ